MIRIGQQEVYNLLKANKGKWFTTRQIAENVKVSIGSTTMSVKKLRKYGMIKHKYKHKSGICGNNPIVYSFGKGEVEK